MLKKLRRFLVDEPFNARNKAQAELVKQARRQAIGAVLGGITDAAYHTPRPWRYETSFIRKVGWFAYWVIDRFFLRKKSPQFQLPLDIQEYTKGKWIVFHSGIRIKKTAVGEIATEARAYFDPYPGHP